MNSEEGDDEATEERDGVRGICGVEALEQNQTCYNSCCREAHIIHRIHNINRKRIQRFVKIIHLHKNTECRDDGEEVGAGPRELVFASES